MAKRANILDIPIEVPPPPFSPWLRLALFDVLPYKAGNALERTQLDFQIVLMVEKTTWLWCNTTGGSIDLYPGDLVFIPPGFTFSWNASEEVHIAVHFDLHANPSLVPYYMNQLTYPLKRRQRHPVDIMPVFNLCMRGQGVEHTLRIPLVTKLRMPEIWRERLEVLVDLYQRHVQDTLEAQLTIGETLQWALLSLTHRDPQTGWKSLTIDDRIAGLLRDMKDPRKRAELEKKSTPALAQTVGMGLKSFRKAFEAATSRTPNEFLAERRIEQAALLLTHGDATVQSIAKSVGYDDPFYFSRVFRRLMKMSPLQYRARHIQSNPQAYGRQIEEMEDSIEE